MAYVHPINAGHHHVKGAEGAVREDAEDHDMKVLPELIEKHLAHLLQRCLDELVEEQHFLSASASGPILKDTVRSCLKKHNCEVDGVVISGDGDGSLQGQPDYISPKE